jgi:hypothetical protein
VISSKYAGVMFWVNVAGALVNVFLFDVYFNTPGMEHYAWQFLMCCALFGLGAGANYSLCKKLDKDEK